MQIEREVERNSLSYPANSELWPPSRTLPGAINPILPDITFMAQGDIQKYTASPGHRDARNESSTGLIFKAHMS